MNELINPAYWFVFGLEWCGDAPLAEAAVAIAPAIIPRNGTSYDADQVLGCADVYAASHGLRAVFFTDITRLLTTAGHSWAGLGVDWEKALRELESGSFPALFLTISARAHMLLCDPSARTPASGGAGGELGAERELVRRAFIRQLAADWPPYIRSLASAGRLRLAR